MSNNIFLHSLGVDAPWFHKNEPGKTRSEPHMFIRDQQDLPVCKINSRNPHVVQNTALIQHAPQLLAALIEYSMNAHAQGIPIDPALITLIHRSGGPDLRSTLSPT